MKLVATSRFDRELSRILKKHKSCRTKVEKTLNFLIHAPFRPSIRYHKLSGTDNYSVSVDMNIRIVFHIETDYIYLLRIGSHEEVY